MDQRRVVVDPESASAAPATASARKPDAKRRSARGDFGWGRLQLFLAVAKSCSFTKTAQGLNLSQSAVSRQISNLEAELHAPLFLRTERGLVLTEAGEHFQAAVQAMASKLALGVCRINERRANPLGPLRLTTSSAFGSGWLAPRLERFHRENPDIDLSLLLVDNRELDLLLPQADCALRFGRQKNPALVQRLLGTFQYRFFGSRKYLARHGIPRSAADLANHKLISAVQPALCGADWLPAGSMPAGCPCAPTFVVNDDYALSRAVENGLGIAALPSYLACGARGIVEVLPDLCGPSQDLYFVYCHELKHSRRLKVLGDYLGEESKRVASCLDALAMCGR